MASGQAPCCQVAATNGAMNIDRFNGVGGTTGDMPAMADHQGTDSVSVQMYGDDQQRSHQGVPSPVPEFGRLAVTAGFAVSADFLMSLRQTCRSESVIT